MNLNPDMECVGTFEQGEELLAAMPTLQPDVVLMDIGLPGMDGITCTEGLKKKWPRTKVVILTGDDSREKILAALTAGAHGYLTKNANRHQVADAIERVWAGGSATSQTVTDELIEWLHWRKDLIERLSATESRILAMRARGLSYKEIGDKLQMAVDTVKTHAKRIMFKTGAASTAEAAFLRRQTV